MRWNKIPHQYKHIHARFRREKIVGVYELPSEHRVGGRPTEKDKEFLAEWPRERIKNLHNVCGVTLYRCAALLGINKHSYVKLVEGSVRPSVALCRRMEMLERQAAEGVLYPNLVPQRQEMRRRLCLYRAWWFAQPPSKDFPEVSFHIRVRWGKGRIQFLELPVLFMPRLRLVKWSGLVDVVRELTLAARRAGKSNSLIAWKIGEQEFWEKYANDTLPRAIIDRSAALVKGAESVNAKKARRLGGTE